MQNNATYENRAVKLLAVVKAVAEARRLLDEARAVPDFSQGSHVKVLHDRFLDGMQRDLTLLEMSMREEVRKIEENFDVDDVRFIDCNHPGVIYVGARSAPTRLADEGGQPVIVGTEFLGEHDEAGNFHTWEVRRF